MALKNAVLLKLWRSDFAGPVEIKQSQTENTVDGSIYSIFEQAKQQLNRSASKRFGFFNQEGEHKQLQALVKNWQEQQIDFLALANKCGSFLQQQIELSDTPIKSAVIFAHESILEQHYFYCFLLPVVEVIQAGNDLKPYYGEAIEANKIQFALRLHLEQYQDASSPKYLTQILGRGAKDLSNSFSDFTNFSEGIDISAQTNEFLDIVENYGDKLEDEKAKKFKTHVLDYCIEQDKIGIPVLLDELSEQLNEETPTAFADFVTGQQQQANNEIHTDRSSLKRYMRYFGRDNSLSISFSAERFGQDIQYEPASGSLRIQKIPKSLKAQLSGFYDKAQQEETH